MIFRNSLRLFIANFPVFWKVFLYKLIVIGACVLLMVPVFYAWGECFESLAFSELLYNFSKSTIFTAGFFDNLFILVDTFLRVLFLLYKTHTFAFFYSLFITFIILPFLQSLSEIPSGEGMYSYMASLSKSSFCASLCQSSNFRAYIRRLKPSSACRLVLAF